MADMIDIPDAVFESVKPGPKNVTPKAETKPEPVEAEDKPKTVVRKAEKPEPKPEPEDDAQEEVEEPKKPTEAQKKMWKLKAAGKEIDFDASDDEQVKKLVEKGLGADETFQTSAQMRKQAESLFEMLKDPKLVRKALEDPRVGHNFSELARAAVWEEIQEQEAIKDLTDEQKEWRRKAKLADEMENQRLADRQHADNLEKQKRQSQWESSYEEKIMSALQIQGVPQTHKTVAEMAWYIEKAIENNHDLSPDEIASHIIKQQKEYFKTNFDHMSEDELAEFLGEHNAEKLRNRDLKKLRSPTSNPFPDRNKPQKAATPRAPKKLDGHDWSNALRNDPFFK